MAFVTSVPASIFRQTSVSIRYLSSNFTPRTIFSRLTTVHSSHIRRSSSTIINLQSSLPSDTELINNVLTFWFGAPLVDRYDALFSQHPLWYQSTPESDIEIRSRFGTSVERALAGDLDHFIGSSNLPCQSELTLVLLVDQFPRHIYRGDAKAFAGDSKARDVCMSILQPERWKLAKQILPVVMRLSFMLPLMHQESIADLDLGAAEAQKMHQECLDEGEKAKDISEAAHQSYEYTILHRNIIKQFGRYPHRNKALGRQSTPEEIEYLKDGPRFGQ